MGKSLKKQKTIWATYRKVVIQVIQSFTRPENALITL